MHVRKFQGETIEETLKQIKSELGPDAIILKTTTNRGLKGAFKRSRVEVTAAITEKTYLKKATLESAVGNENKNTLSEQPASYLSGLIDDYDKRTSRVEGRRNKVGYGKLGLNKRVNDKSELDAFLGSEKNNQRDQTSRSSTSSVNEFISNSPSVSRNDSDLDSEYFEINREVKEESIIEKEDVNSQEIINLNRELNQLKELVNEISLKDVEQKIDNKIEEKHFIKSIYTLLKASGLNEAFLHEHIKDFVAQNCDGTEDELIDHVIQKIQTNLKIDSTDFNAASPGVNLLMGTSNSGQSLMTRKLAALEKGAELIIFGEEEEKFSRKISGVVTHHTTSIAEAISIARKVVEKGNNIFIDINTSRFETEEVSSLHDYCSNNFEVFRTFITLSSIHSESYNLRFIKKYKKFGASINFTHTDLCLDWGSMFNCMYLENLPISYLGNGININGDLDKISDEALLNNLLG
jgi:flagellar biosynthesis protein FlhF